MTQVLALQVNGSEHVLHDVQANAVLLDVLRERLGLTGTKEGCREGECGACTVLLDGLPVHACILSAHSVATHRVETAEFLDDPVARRVATLLAEHGGLQCGFCTPGIFVTLVGLLRRDPQPTETTIRRALDGNLCRCTGYAQIIEAMLDAGSSAAGSEP